MPFLWLFIRSAIATAIDTGDFIQYNDPKGQPYNVTYDKRSFIINGKRSILLGGSVHYPRFSPGQWPDVINYALADGLNHLQIYGMYNESTLIAQPDIIFNLNSILEHT